jgi:hypothetical protein
MVSTTEESFRECGLTAKVTEAAALGGKRMFQIKMCCKGVKSPSVYKSKEDFKSLIQMLKLIGAMNRSKGNNRCQVCSECSVMTMVRSIDEQNLNEFWLTLFKKLRVYSSDAIVKCSSHRGVIQILMDFLSVRNGKYFCDVKNSPEQDNEETINNPTTEECRENGYPNEKCSLNRTLSQKFAAFDSVC